jgi:hypothetical protein
MTEIKWISKFIASDKKDGEQIHSGVTTVETTLTLRGVLISDQVNKNNWCVEPSDFPMIAESFVGVQIRSDHAEKVSSVLGKVTSTEVDTPHDEVKADWDPSNPNPHIHFEAIISTSDNNILVPIKMGFVTGVSPAIDARELLCSTCRKQMFDKNIKNCKCRDGGVLLKNLSARELSIVASPAYEGTEMKVYGFAAAVEYNSLSEDKILSIVEDEILRRGI